MENNQVYLFRNFEGMIRIALSNAGALMDYRAINKDIPQSFDATIF
jgi:hypothetical protein